MRKITIAIAAILFVVTSASCSSDSKKTTTTPATNSTSSSSSSSSDGNAKASLGDAEFCQRLNEAFEAVSDQSGLSGAKEALEVFKTVDPPSELSGVWDDFLKALDEVSQLDANDENGAAQVAARHAQSVGRVSQYVGTSCAAALQSSLSELSDSSSS